MIGTEALALRELRERYISDVGSSLGGGFGSGPRVTDGTRAAYIYMRDKLPYEDEFGLLPFSELR